MSSKSYYANIEASEADPIIAMMDKHRTDTFAEKVDLSIGVYKPENGDVKYVYPSVKLAKTEIYNHDEGHPYHFMSGLPSFVSGAQKVVFGEDNAASGRITSIQTISGTGALHVGFEFLKKIGLSKIYVGAPTWANHVAMIDNNGCEAVFFNHYDPKTGTPDVDSLLEIISKIPSDAALLLQTCCHNPTGADYTQDQWRAICQKVKEHNVLVMFDFAYQGFATGDKDKDAYPIRLFFENELEFLVCESFSKNMGLYGERVGCLHVVTTEKSTIPNAKGLLISIFRAQCSFAPLFGARVASYVMTDFKSQWDLEVLEIYQRLRDLRVRVNKKFKQLGTPGNWDTILNQNGLFWYSGLTPQQVDKLVNEHHIYLTSNGRINVAGINNSNIDRVVECIDKVVREDN